MTPCGLFLDWLVLQLNPKQSFAFFLQISHVPVPPSIPLGSFKPPDVSTLLGALVLSAKSKRVACFSWANHSNP